MVYIFHHIAKSGGTSVKLALSGNFSIVNDYTYIEGNIDEKEISWKSVPPIDLSRLSKRHIVCGHFDDADWVGLGFRLFERYPQAMADRSVKIFTFLRNPIDFYVSLFRFKHMRKEAGIASRREINDKFSDFLEEHKNAYAFLFDAVDVGQLQGIEKYWYVGIYEQLQLSFDILCYKMGLMPSALPQENITRTAVEVSYQERTLVTQQCKADFALYAYAVDRFQRDLKIFLADKGSGVGTEWGERWHQITAHR